jgi:hypothetical protein
MREILTHTGNLCNDALQVHAIDEPAEGGAHHTYLIRTPMDGVAHHYRVELKFQRGPIKTAGVNGLTHEALIAVLIDRLEGFQNGKYANAFNQGALDHLRGAQASLKARTAERTARGVEGTHEL